MKKLYFLAAAALLLASCSNEETVMAPSAKNEVAFNAIVKNSSRGPLDSSSTWTGTIYVASAYQPTDGAEYSDLFNNNDFVEFNYNNTEDYWISDPIYYYPKNGKVDFFAYATGGGSDEVKPNSADINRLTTGDKGIENMVLDYTTNQLQGKTDVMYALAAGNTCPQAGNVTLPVKHALAWLTAEVTEAKDQVKIKSLTIDNIYLTGAVTVPLTNHALSATDPKCSWDVTDATAVNGEFDKYCPATATLIKDLDTDASADLMIVPGVMTTTKQTSLTLKYEMSSAPGVEITNVIDLSTLADWEAGKHYTYKIDIVLNAVTFQCTIDDYNPGTGKNVEL